METMNDTIGEKVAKNMNHNGNTIFYFNKYIFLRGIKSSFTYKWSVEKNLDEGVCKKDRAARIE